MGIWKPSKQLVRDLQQRGVRSRAVVVKIARGGPTSDQGQENSYDPIRTETRRKTSVRLTTGVGEVEVKARLNFRAGGIPRPGDTIPVIYDPDDPERIIVDEQVHLSEVAEAIGQPLEQVIGPASEVHFGDPDELIRRAGHDPTELVERARRLVADPRSAVAPPVDGSAAIPHLEALHAKGLMSDAELEAARRHLEGP